MRLSIQRKLCLSSALFSAFLLIAWPSSARVRDLPTSNNGTGSGNCTSDAPTFVYLPSTTLCTSSAGSGGGSLIKVGGAAGDAFTVTLAPALWSLSGFEGYTLFDVVLQSSDPNLTLRSIVFGVSPGNIPGTVPATPQPVNYLTCVQGLMGGTAVAPYYPFCMANLNRNLMEIDSFAAEPTAISNPATGTIKWDLSCQQTAVNTQTYCGSLAVGGFPKDVDGDIPAGVGGNPSLFIVTNINQITLAKLPVTAIATTSDGTLVKVALNGGGNIAPAPAATNALSTNAVAINSPTFIASADVTNSLPQQDTSSTDGNLGDMLVPPASRPNFVDPATNAPCVGSPGEGQPGNNNYFRAAWYKLNTAGAGQVAITTEGSEYDTRLIVISGDPVTSPTTVACNDDTTTDQAAALVFTAAANTTYYVMASEAPGYVGTANFSYQTPDPMPDGIPAATPLSYDPILNLSVSTTGISSAQSSIKFGSQAVNTTSVAIPVTITATGLGGSLANLKFTASQGFVAGAGDCGTTLADKASCHPTISFDPAIAGPFSGTFQVASSGVVGVNIALSGTGFMSGPQATLSPTSELTFASQPVSTTSSASNVVVTNSGTAPLSISSVSATGDFSSQAANCTAAPVAAGGHCSIMVTFTPTAAGTRSGTLAIIDNAPGSPQQISLSGTGLLNQCSVINYGSGFSGTGLKLNGGATVTGGMLQLTDGKVNEARSAFVTTKVPISSFVTDFTFQLLNPNADGFAFVVQGVAPSALGQGGLGLGYAGIQYSAAVKFDLYNNRGEGVDSTGIYYGGNSPTIPSLSLASSGIDLHSGHIFAVHLVYTGSSASLKITDTTTKAVTTISNNVDMNLIGPTAYVGFTAGTGSSTASQNILSWTYSSGPGCPVN